MELEYHSPIGASSMDRWSSCPGSVFLSRGIRSESSPYAEEGTAAHALAEFCLRNDADVSALVGSNFRYEDHGVDKVTVVSTDMADAVKVYTEYVNSLTGIRSIEHKFDISSLYPSLRGTSDCVVWDEERKELTVIDYKHGKGKLVKAEGNLQLRYYAVGALLTLGYPATSVVITIVQPRCGKTQVRSERIGVVQLLDWIAYLKDCAIHTDEAADMRGQMPDHKWEGLFLKTGSHCYWCPAKLECPLKHTESIEKAQLAFSVVENGTLASVKAS